jgi:cyclopropane fatty-acyl-phospholipid synthase-like methyltransferase
VREVAAREMLERYITNKEYPRYFTKLNELRARIAADLPIKPNTRILDLATGYGYFAIEVAKREPNLKIIGIDISKSDVSAFKRNAKRFGLADRLKVIKMDASFMDFPDACFDMVINFMGLEDIHMTRGREGVEKTFVEVSRVLTPGGYFCFTLMPPEEMETEAQRIEVALFSYVCDCTWLSAQEYKGMLEKNGFELIDKRSYYTGKKLTAEQAKEEIRFACENVPRIYGVKTPSFEEAWSRFGTKIEEHGLGHYSRVVLFIAQKVS